MAGFGRRRHVGVKWRWDTLLLSSSNETGPALLLRSQCLHGFDVGRPHGRIESEDNTSSDGDT